MCPYLPKYGISLPLNSRLQKSILCLHVSPLQVAGSVVKVQSYLQV